MTSTGQKRILVADDTLPMRIMLQDVLTEAGYEVITVSDGEEAWIMLQEEYDTIDLLILDLLMPRMTGFDILEKIKEYPPEIRKKSLVVTGIFKSEKEVQRLKDLGACGYITKSALIDEILFRVNQVFFIGQENIRKFPRLLMSVPVSYEHEGEQQANYTSNFSAGGAFIRTIDPAPKNGLIDVKFRLPSSEIAVTTTGRIVWTNEYETYRRKSSLPGMGIEFLDIQPDVKNELASFVECCLQEEPVWLAGL
jgi:uncharacterized protein (TIGR02266 family)